MPRPSTQAPALDRLIDRLSRLPGIGRRSAQRVAFYLLKQPPEEARQLADAIRDFTTDLKVCRHCGNVSELDPCAICADPKRERGLVLVVEQPSDIVQFEALGTYRGLYHVLMGRLAPLEGVGPGELNVQALLKRVKRGGIGEIILGTNPNIEGDGTALHVAEQLQGIEHVNVTRLARGLPSGSQLEYATKSVLADAITSRRTLD